jgi:hypothetical protein
VLGFVRRTEALTGHRHQALVALPFGEEHPEAELAFLILRSARECFPRRLRRSQRVGRLHERHEERVSLRAYLDTAVTSELLAQHAMVLGQNVRVPIAESLQKPRRAFDVCEQERDGAMRERQRQGARARP